MQLTDFQIGVIERMRKAKLDWVAEATEREWKAGNTYYIDTRCKASKQLRRDFEKGNAIAFQASQSIRELGELLWQTSPVGLQAKADAMTASDRGRLGEQLQTVAITAAWRSAYLDARYGSGCGDQGHDDAVKAAYRVSIALRKAFGFTYPERGAINV